MLIYETRDSDHKTRLLHKRQIKKIMKQNSQSFKINKTK